jgi:hypothetical protein
MSSVHVEFMIETKGLVSASEIAEGVAHLFKANTFAYEKPLYIQACRGTSLLSSENQITTTLVDDSA